ncbi:F0F1 ATP synthase subunit A [Dactylosporangium fulvum]|uniref:ATP synthase subunit a n=1 Tax=Dactylosporangium fulvum TaxID=53359 RepID=A0ABY5WCS0_9ACTN|nr:F0F1 ATP synthase subunit A [Dactylosporangium fulvum]UWP87357.1 F0F1 ATP synthase subunit A [Dactylosporangium fulvum]
MPSLRGSEWGLAFTKITFMVWLAVAVIIVYFLVSYRNPKVVPTKKQWLAESIYGFVRNGVARDVIGHHEGLRFAPYLATLFCFITMTNAFAIIPFFQISPNAHIAFPAVLGVVSYVLFIAVGIRKHGFVKYFKANLFVPGIPWPIYFLVTPIELISTFIMRPVTLAVRLFANMFAGHLMLLVFTLGGVAMLNSTNIFVQGLSVTSFLMAIVMTFFELMVIVLQAYVFTMLTASYVQGALADEH